MAANIETNTDSGDVSSLIETHHPDATIHRTTDDTITIQLHSEDGLEEIVQALLENDYSFEVDQQPGLPPMLSVTNNPSPEA